jgi:Cu/Zn superoxide dismutase
VRLAVAAAAGSLILTTPAAAAVWATYLFEGPLRDFSAATTEPFDGAEATVELQSTSTASQITLAVRGIDPTKAGHRYGAHLHIGPCVAGNAAAALGHYNVSSEVPAEINRKTEVWLDFTVTGAGEGRAVARVPFVPAPSQRSVVIHALPTDRLTGAAGTRLACLPVEW